MNGAGKVNMGTILRSPHDAEVEYRSGKRAITIDGPGPACADEPGQGNCHHGGNEQMFGANQQVPRAGGNYKEAVTAAPAQFLRPVGQIGETRCGISAAGSPPFGGAS